MCSVCEAKAKGFVVPLIDLGDGVDAAADLTILPERSFSASGVYQPAPEMVSKSSFDYEDAAAQISRNNVKWADAGSSSGASQNTGATALGTGGVVTYGFLASDDITPSLTSSPEDYRGFSAEEMARVEYAISLISEAANITFVRVTGADGIHLDDPSQAQMRLMGELDTNGGWASTSWIPSQNKITSALVNIGERGLETPGSYAFLTALHEVGHAIGLSHPSDYNGSGAISYAQSASYYEDSRQFSVMSYWSERETGAFFGNGRYSTGLMLHDIATLHRLYGVNTETRATETVYGFSSNTGDEGWSLSSDTDYFIGAIWDAGGVDRIDVSGYSTRQVIDLREEAFSSTGAMSFNLSIVRGAKIENATGGFGDDLLIGNNADTSFVEAAWLDANGNPLAGAPIGYDGNNVLDGGEGFDTVSYEFGAAAIDLDLSAGTTFDLGLNGTDILLNIEAVRGTAFADRLSGDDGDNDLFGGDGDDTLIGGLGADRLEGGNGTDTASFAGRDGGVIADFSGDEAYILDADGSVDTLTGFEVILGSGFGDSLTGTTFATHIDGGAGDDTLTGNGGADLLIGGAGNDLLIGDGGSATTEPPHPVATPTANADSLSGTSGNDTIDGLAGDDTIAGDLGDDLLMGGAGADALYGGDGNDTLRAGDGPGSEFLDGEGGNDSLVAGDAAVDARGGAGDDTLIGGTQNDTLYGGSGIDDIEAGAGDDIVFAGDSGAGEQYDYVFGDAGNDTLLGEGGDDFLLGGAGNDLLDGGAGYDYLAGGIGADTLDGGGDGGAVYLFDAGTSVHVDMAAGLATITGENDADTFYNILDAYGSDVGNDTLLGDANGNYFDGFGGNDSLVGGGGSDTLIGRTGSDTLLGGDGNDFLDGGFDSDGSGVDVLTGGQGADVFYFRDGADFATITDFAHGIDEINVSSVAGVTSLSHIAFVSDGADVLIDLGKDGSYNLRIQNTSLSAFTSLDFAFGTAGMIANENVPAEDPTGTSLWG